MAIPLQKGAKAYSLKFVTDDRYLVAALISNGVTPDVIAKTKKGICYYTFERKQKIDRLLERYDRNSLTVNMDYFDRVCEMSFEPYDWVNDD